MLKDTDIQLGIDCHNHCEEDTESKWCKGCERTVEIEEWNRERERCIDCSTKQEIEEYEEYDEAQRSRETLPQKVMRGCAR